MIGGIELGGTKTVCGISGDGASVLREIRFRTGSDPVAAIRRAQDFFADVAMGHGPLTGLGVATFGPCDPDPRSPGYGRITTTPKPGWRDTDVLALLREGLPDGLPIAFDTDVNAAALAERRFGAGRGLDDLVYLTIGTGIGGGAIVGGRLVHGLAHPEVGHLPVRRPPAESQRFAGVCPFHGDCLEGVASGPAIEARWGAPGERLPADHPAWALEAGYLAEAVATLVYVLAPQRVVVGGGVGLVPHLIAGIRPRLSDTIAGYIRHPLLDAADYICNPGLGDRAGLIGAFCLIDEEGPV